MKNFLLKTLLNNLINKKKPHFIFHNNLLYGICQDMLLNIV